MDFTDIQRRIEALCMLGGWTNVEPSPNWATLANEGLKLFSSHAQYMRDDTTVVTVADTAEYALTTTSYDWILIEEANYGTTVSLLPKSEEWIRAQNPLWKHTASGQPAYFWMPVQNTIRFYPKPSTGSVTCYLRGIRTETALTSATASPSCPALYHEGIALLGAWHHGKLYARGDERAIAAGYLAEGIDYANKLKSERLSQEATSLQSTTLPRLPERLSLTGRGSTYASWRY